MMADSIISLRHAIAEAGECMEDQAIFGLETKFDEALTREKTK